MVAWHVTSKKKLLKYLKTGSILPPVRAWRTIDAAERFSKQTGRKIIIRIKTDESFVQFEGHRGEALVSNNPYQLQDM